MYLTAHYARYIWWEDYRTTFVNTHFVIYIIYTDREDTERHRERAPKVTQVESGSLLLIELKPWVIHQIWSSKPFILNKTPSPYLCRNQPTLIDQVMSNTVVTFLITIQQQANAKPTTHVPHVSLAWEGSVAWAVCKYYSRMGSPFFLHSWVTYDILKVKDKWQV